MVRRNTSQDAGQSAERGEEMRSLTLEDMSREELIELIERLQWRTFCDITQSDLCLVRVRLMQRRADAMLCEANDQLVASGTCSPEWWEAQAKFDRAMELRKEARKLFADFNLSEGDG